MKISVIVPVYNEEATILELLEKLFSTNFLDTELEVVVVDDGSTDTTKSIIESCKYPIKLIKHNKNKGKSAAFRTGLANSTGEYVIVQDGDLEYNPQDIVKLLQYAKTNRCLAVYGSRRMKSSNKQPKNVFYFGGALVSLVASVLYVSKITDEPTCYKLVKRDIYDSVVLSEERFGFCAEITAKLFRLGYNIEEIPINYAPRSLSEGKKIRYRDGLHAIYILFKYRVLPISIWLKDKNSMPDK